MGWLDVVKRDPVPWLLDPVNPSARYLTLRDIFRRPPSALQAEQEAILRWAPIQALIRQTDSVSFWGRGENPYFGGPMSNFGTFSMLAQTGVPPFPLALKVGEHLLDKGRRPAGQFAPPGLGPVTWLCYTGMALQALWHFGLGEDPRAQSAKAYLVEAVLQDAPTLVCGLSGNVCAWGLVKALGGLLGIPPAQRTADDQAAIEQLARRLLEHPFDFQGRNADWLQLRFPRYYEADILELCHVLSHSIAPQHPGFRSYLHRAIALQNPAGRWVKRHSVSGYAEDIEALHRPSRWLTWEAVHTLMLVYGGNTYDSTEKR
ncbi:MAG: hypothetical protein ACP5HM_07855 [Anaerolineae bacterium]